MSKQAAWRTDLALEAADTGDKSLPEGVFCETDRQDGVLRTTVKIETDAAAGRLGRPRGVYHTLEGPLSLREALCTQTARLLKEALPDGEILVVGLGNGAVTPDALGPVTAQRVVATRHFFSEGETAGLAQSLRPVCCFVPGATGQTGMETAELVKAVRRLGNFSAVVAVDALAARSAARLGQTVQFSDTGIAPGSGVGNRRAELSRRTLGVPVFSLGIPTVIDAATLLHDFGARPPENAAGMVVTPRDIDRVIHAGAEILSTALNRALQPSFTAEEIRLLME